jgi:hypothetical protein
MSVSLRRNKVCDALLSGLDIIGGYWPMDHNSSFVFGSRFQLTFGLYHSTPHYVSELSSLNYG